MNGIHGQGMKPNGVNGVNGTNGISHNHSAPQDTKLTPSMPIAIIGIGCRFPGDATDPEAFWQSLLDAKSARTEIPKSRYNTDGFSHIDTERTGTTSSRTAHFLKEDFTAFDAPFFSVTPKEAKAMDPQQRMLLEVAYEGLENAGLLASDIRGSKTSCFVGSFTSDYKDLMLRDSETLNMYHTTGSSPCLSSNRVSWFFDLRGPSVTVDTACSSSLVAFHLACQNLRSGESEMSIVGGTNLIFGPDAAIVLSGAHVLSPDGKCQTFDEKANGYSRGEGIGSVILKPLYAALRDGDTVRSIITASGSNQDGRTPGISLPSSEAQEALIRDTYTQAGGGESEGLDLMLETGYVEAHGTGTAAGDPLEMSAILNTIGSGGRKQQEQSRRTTKLFVGSVKTNIGHLEGAAGIAGVIKASMVVERGLIPPNLWFDKLNPRIKLDPNVIEIPTKLTSWPTSGIRRASVNSFGFGGANAHVIVEDAFHYLQSHGLNLGSLRDSRLQLIEHINDEEKPKVNGNKELKTNGVAADADVSNGVGDDNGTLSNGSHLALVDIPVPKLFVISAQDQGGIIRSAQQIRLYVEQRLKKPLHNSHSSSQQDNFLSNLAYTLGEKRNLMPWKSFAIATSPEDLQQNMIKVPSAYRSSVTPKIAFIFTGQGAQWYAMGRELLAYPIYRDSLAASQTHLRKLGCSWQLIDELNKSEAETRLQEPELSQPVCTAIQIALVDLLHAWGVHPKAVVGHSSGEIAAAYCVAAISQDAAIQIAWWRGQMGKSLHRIQQKQALKGGSMMVAMADPEMLHERLVKLKCGRAVVACINAPKNCTVSGDKEAVDELYNLLQEEKISCTPLKVDVAYHSHHMEYVREEYLQSLENLPPPSDLSDDDSQLPVFFSALRGKRVHPQELNASYWVENLVSPVNFVGAINSLLHFSEQRRRRQETNNAFASIFIEVGPHAALRGPLKAIFDHGKNNKFLNLSYISVLRRKEDAARTAVKAMGELYALGGSVDLQRINNGPRTKGEEIAAVEMLTDLPPYAWNHSHKFWDESHLSLEHRLREYPRLDLLGSPCPGTVTPQWRNFLRARENPWIKHHQVQSSILYPGAGMVIMAIEGARQIANPNEKISGYELRDIYISSAMHIPDNEYGLEVMLRFEPRKIGTKASKAVWTEFNVSSYSRETNQWQHNCTGLIQVMYESQHLTPQMQDEIRLENQKYKEAYQTAKGNCNIPVESLYDTLSSAGIQHGKAFQNLREIYSRPNGGAGRGVVRIADTKQYMPRKFEHECVIHPTTLDAVFQLLFPVVTGPNEALKEAMVPVSINRLYVSASIGTEPGVELHGFSEGGKTGYGTWDASIFVSTKDWEAPQIIIEKLGIHSLQSLGSAAGSQDAIGAGGREMCFEMVWEEDIDLLTNAQITDVVLKRTPPDADDDTLADRLDNVCLVYMQQTLDWLSSQADNVQLSGIFKLYQEWIQERASPLQVPSSSPSQIEDKLKAAKAALEESSAGSITVALIDRIGENLQAIFRKEVEPLQVMLPGDLLFSFYREGMGTSFNDNVAEYVGLAAYKRPNIRILEIGAGTGGTTFHVLNKLRGADGMLNASNYTYTDITPGFLANAAERFSRDSSIMQFSTLNIEEDPLQQGFERESFDIIVAANVLHATKNISETLQHVRSLLKPGGKLVLSEITGNCLFVGFIMGTLPGWWLGEDDGRKGGPLMTADQWHLALAKNGFSGVDVSVQGDSINAKKIVSLMVSTKKVESEVHVIEDKFAIIGRSRTDGSDPMSQRLQAYLGQNQHKAAVIPWDSLSLSQVKGKYCISLLEYETPFLVDIEDDDFIKLQRVLLESAGVLWITKGATMECSNPHCSLITGLGRSIRNENANVSLATLDLEPRGSANNLDDSVKAIYDVAMSRLARNSEDHEYAVRQGAVHVPRVRKSINVNANVERFWSGGVPEPISFTESKRALKLHVGNPGLLDSLRWEDDESQALPLDEDLVEVKVKAVGINFKDVLVAMGTIKEDVLGIECSGVISRLGSNVKDLKIGDRVYAAGAGTFASFVKFPSTSIQPMPEDMTFEEAASISVIYQTVYYALVTVARLAPGESVLIHAAAGGTGQAAIIVAQDIGADIFVTVSSAEKRALMKDCYGIPDDHIFNSRDLSFAKGILRMTNGEGVDVVLNSLAGEALRQSWYSLAKFGRFIEIGMADILGNTGLDMGPFITNKTFASVNLKEFVGKSTPRSVNLVQKVTELVNQGVAKAVTPLSVFTFSEFEQAFRLLQTGKHMGKLVVKVDESDKVMALPVIPPVPVRSDATYLLVGGLGGIGRSLGQWFAAKGAKHLVFLSRSAATTPDNIAYIKDLKLAFPDVNAVAFNCDVSDRTALQAVVTQCAAELPPIRGVITGAMVLQDAFFETMSPGTFKATLGPKVNGSWNLHELLPRDMDFFIMLSSLVGTMGNRGQGNYAAGNSFQDALAQHRVTQGLRGTTIDLGLILNVGFVVEHDEYVDNIKSLGFQGIQESEVHAILATAMGGTITHNNKSKAVTPQIITGLPTSGSVEEMEPWYWIRDNKFASLRNQYNNTAKHLGADGNSGTSNAMSLQRELLLVSDKPVSVAVELILRALVAKLAKLMMVPSEDIDSTKPLSAYGVDSLVAVEVRNWITHEIKAEVSVFDVMNNVPMSTLANKLAALSKILKIQEKDDLEN